MLKKLFGKMWNTRIKLKKLLTFEKNSSLHPSNHLTELKTNTENKKIPFILTGRV